MEIKFGYKFENLCLRKAIQHHYTGTGYNKNLDLKSKLFYGFSNVVGP